MHPLDRLLWTLAWVFPVAPSVPWLDDVPRGSGFIGRDWPRRHASERGLELTPVPEGGLVDDLGKLSHLENLSPRVREFYEHTGRFDLSIDVHWRWPLSISASVWAWLYGRRWGQLELPAVSDVELTNEIFALGEDGTLWLRRYAGTPRALYISRYDIVRIDVEPHPVIRITFPVPGGAWVVVFRAEPLDGGGLLLTESAGRPGGAGLYLVPSEGAPRYVRALREAIAVRETPTGVDASHTFDLFGIRILELRYGIPLTA